MTYIRYYVRSVQGARLGVNGGGHVGVIGKVIAVAGFPVGVGVVVVRVALKPGAIVSGSMHESTVCRCADKLH